MEFKTILFIIVIIVLLYVVASYVFADVNTLTNIVSGTTMQQISASSLAKSASSTNSSNFTYSIWFYINDWNYNYGKEKVLFGRMGGNSNGGSGGSGGSISYGKDPCPVVLLGAIQNNVTVALSTFSDTNNSSNIHSCNISNVPIQAWCNLLISVYGRTLDIYLDGKLVNTCVLPGIAKINQNADVFVTPAGGFSGWTSKFQYYPNATDPQTAWNIYKAGYGASWLSGIFGNSIQVKFSTVNSSGQETGSFTI